MAEWSVKPTWKKSIIERQELYKDSNTVIVETGWRWGEFRVYTEDDTPPDLESGVDMFDCGYDSEMIETSDGCWEEHDMDDCDEETQQWLEEFFDEGNSWFDLEEHGWTIGDCQMIIDCDLEITRIDIENGTTIYTCKDAKEEVSETKLIPNAKWPFDNATEVVTEYAKFTCELCGYITEDINDLLENPNDDDMGAFICPECNGKVDLN